MTQAVVAASLCRGVDRVAASTATQRRGYNLPRPLQITSAGTPIVKSVGATRLTEPWLQPSTDHSGTRPYGRGGGVGRGLGVG
jgi:hypothetical protein